MVNIVNEGRKMESDKSINKQNEFILNDFRVGNYVSLINRELEFYFNHHTKLKNSLQISRMEGIYLIILKDNPAITQVEIGEILKADAALVSKFTKNLLDKGLIYRKTDEADKRKRFLHLTEKASEVLPQLLESYTDFNNIAFKEFTIEEHKTFVDSLHKFFHNIQEFKKKKTL